MSTDLELLELAAKAAGIEHAIVYDAFPEDGFPTAYAKTSKRTYWNPLSDDGDALRLAVVLRLDLEFAPAATWSGVKKDAPVPLTFQAHGIDPFAATRRAIVRAAAEIGRQRPIES